MSIRLEHVNYVYGADTELSVAALKDVCLTIEDGEFVGLIGHTGSGKSTLVQHLNGLLKDGGHAACLVKPQFEAGREKVGKKGVVRDPDVHLEVLEHFLCHAKESSFTVLGLTYSPIRGPEGNIEYLGYLEKGPWQERTFDLKALVEESHQTLKEHGEGGTT